MKDGAPGVIGEEKLAAGRFLSLKKLSWLDSHGLERSWESAERENFFGAVLIVPRLFPSRRMVVIRQYRPPARRHLFEFPAGLVEAGESPGDAAARELREETGYKAKNIQVFPAAYTTPGMTDESVFMAVADIDETDPENREPAPALEPSELIASVLVGLDELPVFYRRESERGAAFDAKLAAYILAAGMRRPQVDAS